MKKIFAIISVFVTMTACSLDEVAFSTINDEDFYENIPQCKAAVNACYRQLSTFNQDMMFVTEGQADLWTSSSTNINMFLAISPAKPGKAENCWDNWYKAVMYANECIYHIARADLPEEDKMPLVAEARVMRAFSYYMLTCMFDGVPFYTCPVKTFAVQDSIRALPRTPAEDIREFIYDDINNNALPWFNDSNGLNRRPCDLKENRAGYAMGLMLMAKAAMWNKEWEKALDALGKLEDIYGELSEASYPLEMTKWQYDNAPESIFEIFHEWSYTGTQYTGNIAGLMMPRHTGEGIFDGLDMKDQLGNTLIRMNGIRTNDTFASFKYDSDTGELTSTSRKALFFPLPLKAVYVDSLGKYGDVVIDAEAISTGVVVYKGQNYRLDRRIPLLFGLGDYKTGRTFDSVKKGILWAGPRFWCPDMVQNYDSNNYRIFRYADAVLMMAECHAMLGQTGKAKDYYNMVRRRAGVEESKGFADSDDAMQYIRAERARELAGEFHRKFDLVRWGIWYEQTKTLTDHSTLRSNIRPYHQYYPIPDKQCALSKGALSNPEYSASL